MVTWWRTFLFVLSLGLIGPSLIRAQNGPSAPTAVGLSETPSDTCVPAAKPTPSPEKTVDGEAGSAGSPGAQPPEQHIGGNPSATNTEVGTGDLGQILGLDQLGIRVGGIFFYDETVNFFGGVQPGGWAGQEMLQTEIAVDLEKLCGWHGAKCAADLLQHNGSPAGNLTGDVMSFEGLDGGPPLRRTELYQLWFLQSLYDDRLAIRIGKLVPTYQFANVASVTSLIPTAIFTMPTMLQFKPNGTGGEPGYPDSACGVTVEAFPTEHYYGYFGFYDGRLGGSATPTGLLGPKFNGQYFYIGEVGTKYTLSGANKLDGKAGIGVFYQTGRLQQFDGNFQHGAAGFYLIATQQLWNANPGVDNRGIAAFFQFGRADPNVQEVQTYLAGGLAWRGFLSCRPKDSVGIGMFWGELTDAPGAGNLRANETTFQCYYQGILSKNWFVQPVLTYINDPGSNRNLANPLALTLRLGLVF